MSCIRLITAWSLSFVNLFNIAYSQSFTNLSFDHLDENKSPQEWQTKPDKIKIIADDGYQGTGRSVRISEGNSFQQLFFQRQKVSAERPMRFSIEVHIRTQDVPAFPSTGLFFFHANNEHGEMLFYTDNQSIRGFENWQLCSLDVFIPRKTVEITLGVGLQGEGRVWFDDIKLKEATVEQTAEMSAEAQAFLDGAIDSIQSKAVRSHDVNFDDIRQFAYTKAKGAESPKDTYPAIRLALRMTLDGHSKLITSQDFKDDYGFNNEGDSAESADTPVSFKEKRIGHNKEVAYLSVPSFASADSTAQQQFARQLQGAIRKLDDTSLSGWMVDLREDNGGSNAPMLLGLAPLFDEDEGPVFGYTDNQQNINFWNIKEGSVYVDSTLYLSLTSNYKLHNTGLPIAVLMGPVTQSAGEAIVASFAGKDKTKSFGLPSGGATHGNDIVFLPDSSVIVLSSGYLTNRDGEVYQGGIKPDVSVSHSTTKKMRLAKDPVVREALRWIENHTAERAP